MGSNSALALSKQISIWDAAAQLQESGLFGNITRQQMMVKLMAAYDLGIGYYEAAAFINIIGGKPAFAASLIASMIKRSGKYRYKVLQINNDGCEIEFFEFLDGKWESCGPSSIFTKEDAVVAETGKMVAPGASKNMLARFTRNMLFSRALTNGARWFCPDVFGGAVYTPDELGAETDEEGNITKLPPIDIKAQMLSELDALGQFAYNSIDESGKSKVDGWTSNSKRLCMYVTKNRTDRPEDLTTAEIGTLISGITKKLNDDAEKKRQEDLAKKASVSEGDEI